MYQVESIVNVFYRHVLSLRTEGGKDDICGPGCLVMREKGSGGKGGYGNDGDIPRLPGTRDMYKIKDSLTSAL